MPLLNIENLAREYIEAFNRRDLAALEKLFDPTVTLRDWTLQASGKSEVIKATQGIFSATTSLIATIVAITLDIDACKVAVELSMLINEDETILVVDIIEFTNAGLIKSIRAYKG